MLIIGAKGFAKEVLETLNKSQLKKELCFYDDDDFSENHPRTLFEKYTILKMHTPGSKVL